MRLVWVNRVYSKNFITDFIQDIRNIVGGRLKGYEDLLNQAIEETYKEFHDKYPGAINHKIDTEEFTSGGLMVTIYGEIL